jgi:hypothetical protein
LLLLDSLDLFSLDYFALLFDLGFLYSIWLVVRAFSLFFLPLLFVFFFVVFLVKGLLFIEHLFLCSSEFLEFLGHLAFDCGTR